MVLLVDLNVLLKLLSLRESEHFSPVSEDLHTVEMRHFLFLLHVLLQLLPLLSDSLHLVVHVLEHRVGVLYLDGEPFVLVVRVATTFNMFA